MSEAIWTFEKRRWIRRQHSSTDGPQGWQKSRQRSKWNEPGWKPGLRRLSVKSLRLDDKKLSLEAIEASLREREERLTERENELARIHREGSVGEISFEDELAKIRRLTDESDERATALSERERQLESHEEEVRSREERLNTALSSIIGLGSDLDERSLYLLRQIRQLYQPENPTQNEEEARTETEVSIDEAAEVIGAGGRQVEESSKTAEGPREENRTDGLNGESLEEEGTDLKLHKSGDGPSGGKPYVRGPLRQRDVDSGTKDGPVSVETEVRDGEIDLGSRRENTGQSASLEKHGYWPSQADPNAPKRKYRIEAPYVEMNLDESEVFLILPKQEVIGNKGSGSTASSLTYRVFVDESEYKFEARVSSSADYQLEVEEIRIRLKNPIHKFRIDFPIELQDRSFKYEHANPAFYAFVPVTNSVARMWYLFDANRRINRLPRRNLWILLRDDYQLDVAPDVEERWVWGRYKPLLVNREKIAGLTVRDISGGRPSAFPSENVFLISGAGLIVDDLVDSMPLFKKGPVTLKAPTTNPEGWVVWLQNSEVGSHVLTEKWTGKDPLEIRLPEDLPTGFGQFQVDICDQNDRISIDTLFFRHAPLLALEYPHELFLPESGGHVDVTARVIFENDSPEVQVLSDEETKMAGAGCSVEIPSGHDTAVIRISGISDPHLSCPIQITVNRPRWQIGADREWRDTCATMERNEVSRGLDADLSVAVRECRYEHKMVAILATEFRELQRTPFVRKGPLYRLRLNTFYDTILASKENVWLHLRIHDDIARAKDVPLIKFTSVFVCLVCNFGCSERNEVVEHVSDLHMEHYMLRLTLEEMRAYDSSLPHFIYKCGHDPCHYYSKEDSLDNPTSRIITHIMHECTEVDHSRPVKISFSVIRDIDEIRRNVFPHLPDFRKCRFCDEHCVLPASLRE